MPIYRYTPGKVEDNYHPRRQMIHLWAAAWTETIAMAVDGLDQGQRWDVYAIVHEIRKRVEGGDFGPPLALPEPQPHAQAAMKLEVTP